MKRATKFVALVGIAGLTGFQFVPVERSNPLGVGDLEAPREIERILRRSCYDCHSGETRWPIWAYVAPMSWQVVADVEKARRAINFSEWSGYSEGQQLGYRMMVGPVTATHRMPVWYYLALHPDAKLSPDDVELLQSWSQGVPPDPSFSLPP